MTITPERTIEINHLAWDYWRWHSGQDADWTRRYLADRGLRGTQAGLAPDGWARLVPTLRKRGVADEELEAAGLAIRSGTGSLGDAFRNRLVLAIRDHDDRIVGFTARRHPGSDHDADPPPKYINTTTTPVFDKSHVLYGLDQAAIRHLAQGGEPVLAEGALDVEAIKRLGTEYVPLAGCGTAITEGHLQAIRDVDPSALSRLVTALDPDEAGTKGTTRIWNMLTDDEAGMARTAALPDGADPAELVRLRQTATLRAALDAAAPMTHAVVDHILTGHRTTEVEGRVSGARAVAAHLVRLDYMPLAAAGVHLGARLGGQSHDYELAVSEVVAAIRTNPAPPSSADSPAPRRSQVLDTSTPAATTEAARMRAANGFTAPATRSVAGTGAAPGSGPPAAAGQQVNDSVYDR